MSGPLYGRPGGRRTQSKSNSREGRGRDRCRDRQPPQESGCCNNDYSCSEGRRNDLGPRGSHWNHRSRFVASAQSVIVHGSRGGHPIRESCGGDARFRKYRRAHWSSWLQRGWLFAGLRRTAEHAVRDPEHRPAGVHERRDSLVSTRLHVCLIRQHFIEASVVP